MTTGSTEDYDGNRVIKVWLTAFIFKFILKQLQVCNVTDWLNGALVHAHARTTHTHTTHNTLHHESNFWEQLCSCRLTFSWPWKALETISNPGDLQHFNYNKNNLIKVIKVGLSKKNNNCESKATHLIIYKTCYFKSSLMFHQIVCSSQRIQVIQWLKCS